MEFKSCRIKQQTLCVIQQVILNFIAFKKNGSIFHQNKYNLFLFRINDGIGT